MNWQLALQFCKTMKNLQIYKKKIDGVGPVDNRPSTD